MIPRVKTRTFGFFVLITFISFVWADSYAGTAPNQSANLLNVNCIPVSPVESPTPTPTPTKTCKVSYVVIGGWSNWFTGSITIQNTGKTPIQGWTLKWGYSGNQTISTVTNGSCSQSGKAVNVINAECNKLIPAGGAATFTFLASYSGTNTSPTVFSLE